MSQDKERDKKNDPFAPEEPDIEDTRRPKKDPKDNSHAFETSDDKTAHTAKKKRAKIIAASACVLAVSVLYLGYESYTEPKNTQTLQKKEKPKGYIEEKPEQNSIVHEEEKDTSEIQISAKKIQFENTIVGSGSQHNNITLHVKAGSYKINSASIPYGHNTGLQANAEDCIEKTMHEGDQCSIDVSFDPSSPINANNLTLDIQGLSYGNHSGKSKEYSAYIPISASAKPAPVIPHNDTLATGTETSPFSSSEDIKKAQAKEKDEEEKQAQEEARNEYLASQAQPAISTQSSVSSDSSFSPQSMAGVLQQAGEPPRDIRDFTRPLETTWADHSVLSSFPYDMSRLVSVGTPIPAVIKYSIDSRYHTTAVATVERDIYGEDGRIVVIERGSEIIGSASGSDSGGSGGNSSMSQNQNETSSSGQSNTSSSNEKMTVQWRRIRRPDGVIFSISGTSGDAMGTGGIPSVNDDRPLQRFGSGVITTILEAIGVGATGGSSTSTNTGGSSFGGFSSGGTTSTTMNSKAMAAQVLQQGLTPLANEFSSEHLSMPIIRIVPAGTAFTIFLNQDIELRPIVTKYQARLLMKTQNKGGQTPAFAQRGPQTNTSINSQPYQYPGSQAGNTGGMPYQGQNQINPYGTQKYNGYGYGPSQNGGNSGYAQANIEPNNQYTPVSTPNTPTNNGFPSATEQSDLNKILSGK